MSKKKRNEITGQNLVKLTQIKDGFFIMCQQYEHMGKLLKLQSKTLTHPIFAPSSAPECLKRILEQYVEMGEQLKEIGRGLDSLGGKPVLEKPKDAKSFVSNISPVKNDTKIDDENTTTTLSEDDK